MPSPPYTPRQVARLLKISERHIRTVAGKGLIGAVAQTASAGASELKLDFRDLVVLRLTSRLLERGVGPSRVVRVLDLLRRQLGPGQPLSAVKLEVDHGRVLASCGENWWEPESGQVRLDFGGASDLRSDEPGDPANVRPVAADAGGLSLREHLQLLGDLNAANDWFDLALELEGSNPTQAFDAYLRALTCDPEHAESAINIGRLCAEAGDTARAAAYFRQAVRLAPEQPVAHFNLAVTLHDLGDLAGARCAYETALAGDPRFADAHHNLAALLDELEEHEEASAHRRAYRDILESPDP